MYCTSFVSRIIILLIIITGFAIPSEAFAIHVYGNHMILATVDEPFGDIDLYNSPALTQEQALNQDYYLGSTNIADTQPASRTIEGILAYSSRFLNRIAPFIVTLTLLTFIWGMFQLVRSGSEEARKEGRQVIIFGVIALFVMVSVWGLVNLLRRTTGLTGASTAPQGPGVPRFK